MGDVVHGAEPGRARGRAKAGMARRDDPEAPREAIEKRPGLRDIIAAMQEQQRRARASDHRLDRNAGYVDAFHPAPRIELSLRGAQLGTLVPAMRLTIEIASSLRSSQ